MLSKFFTLTTLMMPFLAEAGTTFECGQPGEKFRVMLSTSIQEMPREGELPARFENLDLVFENSVKVTSSAEFNGPQIHFRTAYCGFGIQTYSPREGVYRVWDASVECEGESREIACRLL